VRPRSQNRRFPKRSPRATCTRVRATS
jgi:hypothetical protein